MGELRAKLDKAPGTLLHDGTGTAVGHASDDWALLITIECV
jgi:hypothetical protein